MTSRANSLRAYAEQLLESDNTTLAAEKISGLVDDLIEFAEQWEAELLVLPSLINIFKRRFENIIHPDYMSKELTQAALEYVFAVTPSETDAAGILIRPQVKVE